LPSASWSVRVGHRSHPAVGVVAVCGAAALGVDLGRLLAGRDPDLLAAIAVGILLGDDQPAGPVMVPAPLETLSAAFTKPAQPVTYMATPTGIPATVPSAAAPPKIKPAEPSPSATPPAA